MKPHAPLLLLATGMLVLPTTAQDSADQVDSANRSVAAGNVASAPSLDREIEALRESLEKLWSDLSGSPDGEDVGNPGAGSRDERMANQLRSLLDRGNLEESRELERVRQLLEPIGRLDSELATQTSEIFGQLGDLNKTAVAARVAELEAAFVELAEDLLRARDPQEMDPWLLRITKLSDTGGKLAHHAQATDSELRRMEGQLQTARQIVVQWQDYLMGVKLENPTAAKQSMASLANLVSQFPYVPRSRVIERQARLERSDAFGEDELELQSREDYLERLTSLDAIAAVHGELGALNPNRRQERDLQELHTDLERFTAGRNHLLRGDLSSGSRALREIRQKPYLRALANQAMIEAIRASVPVPEDFETVEGESAEHFSERYLKSVSGNVDSLWRALMTLREFHTSGAERTMIGRDLEAVEYLLAARAYEKQKQFARAIVAYRQFLGTVSRYCPKGTAGEQMVRLQEEHPEASEAAAAMNRHTDGVRLPQVNRLSERSRELIREEVERVLLDLDKAAESGAEKPAE